MTFPPPPRCFARAIACLVLAGLAGRAGATGSPPPAWPIPTATNRPWTFNWWHGSAVDKGNLTRMIHELAGAGMGGLHVIPIYGVQGAEDRSIPYLSDRWLEMFGHAAREARGLGMDIDLTSGTGWCFGGPAIPADSGGRKLLAPAWQYTRGKRLPDDLRGGGVVLEFLTANGPGGAVVDLRAMVGEDGGIGWDPPSGDWLVTALASKPTGQMVKRASPGGEGLMLNPFEPAAMAAFLEPLRRAFGGAGAVLPRAMYHDSYEYYGADWAKDLAATFAIRNGYSLAGELPAFSGHGPAERVARVRQDYRATLDAVMLEAVFPQWTGWCKERGILTRNQAHGAPVNLLDFYALADIPEAEMFGHGGPDPLVSRYDEHIGGADRNPLVAMFASSAAHLEGKNLVSAETGTWLAEHFCESPAELKGLIDLLLLAGVNHIMYHGCAYSPADAAWPGWVFYAATQLNPRNPLWREMPVLNAYVTRCQSLLQASRPDNDVLLYWPIHDLHAGGAFFQFTVHDPRWLTGSATGRAARLFRDGGIGFDYVSDRLLEGLRADAGGGIGRAGNRWKVVFVPATGQVPVATMAILLKLAEDGATVYFEDVLPVDVPGLGRLDARRAELQALLQRAGLGDRPAGGVPRVVAHGRGRIMVGAAQELAARVPLAAEPMAGIAGIRFLRRATPAGPLYFVVNHGDEAFDGWLPLATGSGAVAAMDPMTGATGWIDSRPAGAWYEVRVRVEAGHSLILRCLAQSMPDESRFVPPRPGADVTTVGGPWSVDFLTGGPTIPAALRLDAPACWTVGGDPARDAFAGTAVYRSALGLPADFCCPPRGLLLELGDVHEVARVRVNGRDLGAAIMPPFRFVVPATALHGGENRLEVEVTNHGANRIRDLDRRKVPWRIFHDINFVSISYKPFDASVWPIHPSGLAGPVRLRYPGPAE